MGNSAASFGNFFILILQFLLNSKHSDTADTQIIATQVMWIPAVVSVVCWVLIYRMNSWWNMYDYYLVFEVMVVVVVVLLRLTNGVLWLYLRLTRWSVWRCSCLHVSCSRHFVGDEDYSCFGRTTHALTRGWGPSDVRFQSKRTWFGLLWLHTIPPMCFLWVGSLYGTFLACVFFFSGL